MSLHPDLSESLKKRQKIDRYSTWMYNSFKKYLGKRILDIGSGTGNIINHYINDCEKLVATDIFEHQIEYIKQRFKNHNNIECFVFDITIDSIEKYKEYKFDTITCINVLEHIENDFEALRKMKEIINDEGYIIVLVPAFKWLYGTMDKDCGHYRRYNSGILKGIAEQLGLKVVENKYFNLLGVVPWYLKGKIIRKRGTFSEDLNEVNSKMYNFASMFLEPFEKIIKIPFGLSEIIVMQKNT